LEIRFFSKTVYHAWTRWTKSVKDPIRDTIRIINDVPEGKNNGSDVDDAEEGIGKAIIYRRMAHLPIDYNEQKSYVEKAKDIVDFEREGSCKVCNQELEHDGGLYIICPTIGCETVTHMACLSKHFMKEQKEDELVPISGNCPGCNSELIWVDIVKELSLRMRGEKEVQNLLKVKRVRKGKAGELLQITNESSDIEQGSGNEADTNDDVDMMKDFALQSIGAPSGDSWHIISDSEASDAESIASSSSCSENPTLAATRRSKPAPALRKIVEDSDWDEAEILD
jgi:structure-specific endonuclease subunit SLX1